MIASTIPAVPIGESWPQPVEEVLGLLRRQAALFLRLEQFASRQRTLVREDDAAPLLSLLADRQKLSAELTGIARQLAGVRAEWPAFRERLSGDQRAEADVLLRDSSLRLRRVMEGDETDARLLCVRRGAVADDLRVTHAAGEAVSAYRTPAMKGATAGRLDQSS
jgi:hypothetical protein